MVYTVEQIAQRILPVAQKYGLKAVYLFGSYARGTATDSSDIDLLIDTSGTNIKSLLTLSAVYCDLEDALRKSIDLIIVLCRGLPCGDVCWSGHVFSLVIPPVIEKMWRGSSLKAAPLGLPKLPETK